MVDGVASEWIPIISGVPQGSVLGPLLFILYTSEMFELVENRPFSYADDFTLLAVIRKPADRPAVAASLNRDLARIQEWCKIITKLRHLSLVDPGLLALPMVTWSCLWFLSELIPTSTSLT